jgi:hypothetical protein
MLHSNGCCLLASLAVDARQRSIWHNIKQLGLNIIQRCPPRYRIGWEPKIKKTRCQLFVLARHILGNDANLQLHPLKVGVKIKVLVTVLQYSDRTVAWRSCSAMKSDWYSLGNKTVLRRKWNGPHWVASLGVTNSIRTTLGSWDRKIWWAVLLDPEPRLCWRRPATVCSTYWPTPRRCVCLEAPAVAQLLKNFPKHYGTRRFITVFTRPLHEFLSWGRRRI